VIAQSFPCINQGRFCNHASVAAVSNNENMHLPVEKSGLFLLDFVAKLAYEDKNRGVFGVSCCQIGLQRVTVSI
jgi:hypothetical protein